MRDVVERREMLTVMGMQTISWTHQEIETCLLKNKKFAPSTAIDLAEAFGYSNEWHLRSALRLSSPREYLRQRTSNRVNDNSTSKYRDKSP